MATKFKDVCAFENLSLVGGSINLGSATNYSITSFSAADRSLAAGETTAADIAAVVATIISDLGKKGLLTVDGGE